MTIEVIIGKITFSYLCFSKNLIIKFGLNRNQNSFTIVVQIPEKNFTLGNHYRGIKAKEILIQCNILLLKGMHWVSNVL